MMSELGRLVKDRSGSAAAEMALVVPFLLVLMLGAIDLGNYFMSEHVIEKSVRDAARYAARLPMTSYDCGSNTVDSTSQTQIEKVARTGDPNGTTPKLPGWTADGMASVSLVCDTDTTNIYVNKGVYDGFPDGGAVPVVTVSATVPYNTLFGVIGLGAVSLNLKSQSQAAVIGA
jgi:Flp pilus assembly protein TadG